MSVFAPALSRPVPSLNLLMIHSVRGHNLTLRTIREIPAFFRSVAQRSRLSPFFNVEFLRRFSREQILTFDSGHYPYAWGTFPFKAYSVHYHGSRTHWSPTTRWRKHSRSRDSDVDDIVPEIIAPVSNVINARLIVFGDRQRRPFWITKADGYSRPPLHQCLRGKIPTHTLWRVGVVFEKKNYIFAGHSDKTSVLIFPSDFSIQSSVISSSIFSEYWLKYSVKRYALTGNERRPISSFGNVSISRLIEKQQWV